MFHRRSLSSQRQDSVTTKLRHASTSLLRTKAAAEGSLPPTYGCPESSSPVPSVQRSERGSCYTNRYTVECVEMPTNLAIDDKLIEQARRVGHHKTKKEAVTAALSEYIAHRKRLE